MPHTARADRPEPRVTHRPARLKASARIGRDVDLRKILRLYYGDQFHVRAARGLGVTRRTVDRWLSGQYRAPSWVAGLLLERLAVRGYELGAQHARALDELAVRHAGRLADLRELETILRGVVVRPGPPRHWSGLRKKKRDP